MNIVVSDNYNKFLRSKSSGKIVNEASMCSTERSFFYDTVLAHGDGSIKNVHHRKVTDGVDNCRSPGQIIQHIICRISYLTNHLSHIT